MSSTLDSTDIHLPVSNSSSGVVPSVLPPTLPLSAITADAFFTTHAANVHPAPIVNRGSLSGSFSSRTPSTSPLQSNTVPLHALTSRTEIPTTISSSSPSISAAAPTTATSAHNGGFVRPTHRHRGSNTSVSSLYPLATLSSTLLSTSPMPSFGSTFSSEVSDSPFPSAASSLASFPHHQLFLHQQQLQQQQQQQQQQQHVPQSLGMHALNLNAFGGPLRSTVHHTVLATMSEFEEAKSLETNVQSVIANPAIAHAHPIHANTESKEEKDGGGDMMRQVSDAMAEPSSFNVTIDAVHSRESSKSNLNSQSRSAAIAAMLPPLQLSSAHAQAGAEAAANAAVAGEEEADTVSVRYEKIAAALGKYLQCSSTERVTTRMDDITDFYELSQKIGKPGQYGFCFECTRKPLESMTEDEERDSEQKEEKQQDMQVSTSGSASAPASSASASAKLLSVPSNALLGVPRPLSATANRDTEEMYVCKRIQKAKYHDLQLLRDEINSLRTVNHPHIVRLLDLFEDDNYLYLVTERCSGGELFQRIKDLKRYTERHCARVMAQLLSAVNHMHSRRIIHADLKPDNILYKTNHPLSEISVVDFGFSHFLKPKEKLYDHRGTCMYMAPECVLKRAYSFPADLWSCGVILFVLLFGYQPFRAPHHLNAAANKAVDAKNANQQQNYQHSVNAANQSIFQQVLQGFNPRIHNGYGAHFPADPNLQVSDLARDLMKRLLIADPSKRLTAEEALDHPWINLANTTHPDELTDNQIQLLTSADRITPANADLLDRPLSPLVIHGLKTMHIEARMKAFLLRALFASMSTGDRNDVDHQFDLMDVDKNGVICLSELVEALRAMRQKNESKYPALAGTGRLSLTRRMSVEEEALAIMQQADLNRDGVLSREEVELSVVQQRLNAKEERIQSAFFYFDKNHDGNVTVDEIYEILLQAGVLGDLFSEIITSPHAPIFTAMPTPAALAVPSSSSSSTGSPALFSPPSSSSSLSSLTPSAGSPNPSSRSISPSSPRPPFITSPSMPAGTSVLPVLYPSPAARQNSGNAIAMVMEAHPLGHELTEAYLKSMLRGMLMEVDRDGNGVIDYQEFFDLMNQQINLSEEEIREHNALIDRSVRKTRRRISTQQLYGEGRVRRKSEPFVVENETQSIESNEASSALQLPKGRQDRRLTAPAKTRTLDADMMAALTAAVQMQPPTPVAATAVNTFLATSTAWTQRGSGISSQLGSCETSTSPSAASASASASASSSSSPSPNMSHQSSAQQAAVMEEDLHKSKRLEVDTATPIARSSRKPSCTELTISVSGSLRSSSPTTTPTLTTPYPSTLGTRKRTLSHARSPSHTPRLNPATPIPQRSRAGSVGNIAIGTAAALVASPSASAAAGHAFLPSAAAMIAAAAADPSPRSTVTLDNGIAMLPAESAPVSEVPLERADSDRMIVANPSLRSTSNGSAAPAVSGNVGVGENAMAMTVLNSDFSSLSLHSPNDAMPLHTTELGAAAAGTRTGNEYGYAETPSPIISLPSLLPSLDSMQQHPTKRSRHTTAQPS